VTKVAAEGLCEMVHRTEGLPCLVLRTSRFFPEADDRAEIRHAYADGNVKVTSCSYRRVDLEDVVSEQLLVLERAADIGFGRYVISATTPFTRDELMALRADASAVVAGHFPGYAAIYAARGWRMFPGIERVYVNAKARDELGWRPRHDFGTALARLAAGEETVSPLARRIGTKGYHDGEVAERPSPLR
jgi:UDP-glucose 4-epimerase